jgi:tetratricopeptide (TPR) repeat protein
MTELLNNLNRQLIPRWHTSRKMSLVQVPSSLSSKVDHNAQLMIKLKTDDWKSNPSTFSAIELFVGLESANIVSSLLYDEVKSYLLTKYEELSPAVKRFINPQLKRLDPSSTYESDEERIHGLISTLKGYVRQYPHDALTWNDLAFYYASIGESNKAERSMRTAYHLFSQHPFLARSYARLLVHQNEPGKALHILKKTGLNKSHPEILSADIAIRTAFDIGKPDISVARRLIDKYSKNHLLISELSASVGTIEVENGALKKGRAHLMMSSIQPTENTVAQLKWMLQQHKVSIPLRENTIQSLEANAIYFYNRKDYKSCRNELIELHKFQPFSFQALADAGYMSLIGLDDPGEVIDFSEYYSHFLPGNVIAQNNYIVAKMEMGNMEGLEKRIQEVSFIAENDRDKAMISATLGMYLYLTDDIGQGRKLYENSQAYFKSSKNNISHTIALLYQGMMEKQLGLSSAEGILKAAKKEAENMHSHPEVLQKINREISKTVVIAP